MSGDKKNIEMTQFAQDGIAHTASNYLINGHFKWEETGVFLLGDFIYEAWLTGIEGLDFFERKKKGNEYAVILERTAITTAVQFLMQGGDIMNKVMVNGAASIGTFAFDGWQKDD